MTPSSRRAVASAGRTTLLAELGVATVVKAIERLGFRVSTEKTQAIWFLGGTKRVAPSGNVRRGSVYVGGKAVQVRDTMKYLGLLLDGRWTFEDHFGQLAPRLEQTCVALCLHLPNIGGADERVRRLYSGVIRSMALYDPRLTISVVMGYRTVSHEAVTALVAGLLPLDLLAGMEA
ncbi:uncharacterized protein LOC143220225 [Lasioglossum baleicum]|uniref:uncharacterized protein LOC143220225 n=1 Tax=Lasioglossum baleicum TaxID=434251 RepID=UPI003FCE0206